MISVCSMQILQQQQQNEVTRANFNYIEINFI